MGNSHPPASLLPLLLASGCDPVKPANSRDIVKDATKDVDLSERAKESEWYIGVTVDSERRVFFRKEPVGTTEEVGALKERVRQAIERNRRAARDSGDKEAAEHAATVFICAPEDFKYGDVSKVVDALKEAGGNPVGLSTCDPSRR